MKKHKNVYPHRWVLSLVFFLLLLTTISIGVWSVKFNSQKKSLASYTQNIIQKCQGSKQANLCYNRELPKLMDNPTNISMEEVFAVTKKIQKEDSSFNFCHVLGHKVSEKETEKDPSKWQEVIGRCPIGICSNGCIHGAFQQRFRKETLSSNEIGQFKAELLQICRKSKFNSGLTKGSCIHAVGHLFMYITSGDIKKSISLCNDMAQNKDIARYRDICFDGAFMQIFQPLETEDFSLIKHIQVNKTNVFDFCSQFDGETKLSCWRESWPLAYKQIMSPNGLEEFCGKLDSIQQPGCFTSLYYIIPVQLHFNTEEMKTYCMGLSQQLQAECLGIGAARFIQNDYANAPTSIQFCKDAPTDELKNACFNTLAQFASFTFPKGKLLKNFCSLLPKEYQTRCEKK